MSVYKIENPSNAHCSKCGYVWYTDEKITADTKCPKCSNGAREWSSTQPVDLALQDSSSSTED